MSFPIACFSLALVADIIYWRTANLLWLHFSEWLLFAGLVFGLLALLAILVSRLATNFRPVWTSILGGIAVLLLAAVNSFVHTADGWTAVVPYGMALSALTVITMIVSAWLACRGGHYV